MLLVLHLVKRALSVEGINARSFPIDAEAIDETGDDFGLDRCRGF